MGLLDDANLLDVLNEGGPTLALQRGLISTGTARILASHLKELQLNLRESAKVSAAPLIHQAGSTPGAVRADYLAELDTSSIAQGNRAVAAEALSPNLETSGTDNLNSACDSTDRSLR